MFLEFVTKFLLPPQPSSPPKEYDDITNVTEILKGFTLCFVFRHIAFPKKLKCKITQFFPLIACVS